MSVRGLSLQQAFLTVFLINHTACRREIIYLSGHRVSGRRALWPDLLSVLHLPDAVRQLHAAQRVPGHRRRLAGAGAGKQGHPDISTRTSRYDKMSLAQEMTALQMKEEEDEVAKEAALRASYGPVPPGPRTKQ